MRPHEVSYKVIGAAMAVHSVLGAGLLDLACIQNRFVVEDCVVVEVKAVDKILPVHRAQPLSYIKLAKLPLGLLITFKTAHLKDGICRRINAPEADL
jgi:hypothetical protein